MIRRSKRKAATKNTSKNTEKLDDSVSENISEQEDPSEETSDAEGKSIEQEIPSAADDQSKNEAGDQITDPGDVVKAGSNEDDNEASKPATDISSAADVPDEDSKSTNIDEQGPSDTPATSLSSEITPSTNKDCVSPVPETEAKSMDKIEVSSIESTPVSQEETPGSTTDSLSTPSAKVEQRPESENDLICKSSIPLSDPKEKNDMPETTGDNLSETVEAMETDEPVATDKNQAEEVKPDKETESKDDDCIILSDEQEEQSAMEVANQNESQLSKEDTDTTEVKDFAEKKDNVAKDEVDDSRMSDSKSDDSDGFEVLDEIDLTKSDEEAGIEAGEEEEEAIDEEEPVHEYIIPDYDDPKLKEIEIDPEQDTKKKIKESKDFLKYWRPVQDNPQEFTSWTYLLQFVEQDGKLPLARRAFNSFFSRYPLCYGYWKKFSELERKNGNILRAQKILERGVREIPLSIDLWVHVIDFYINHYDRPDAGIDKARIIFERAIAAAGEEFRSEKLWNKFIKWEIQNKNWLGVMDIYRKVLSTQTQHYSLHFNEFKAFVNKHSPADLLKQEKFEEMLESTRSTLTAEALKRAGDKANDKDEDNESAIEEMDEAPPGVDDSEKPPNEEELKAIRLQIIKDMKEVYDITEKAVTKIWAFEEGIKRPYFHVKQLERAQLKNWREYLDMEIAKEDHHRIVLLFERCLIACALYEDFWLKYARYMSKVDKEKTAKIYEKACTVHLPKKPNIHIQWAAHEEQHGNIEKARSILGQFDNVFPGMAMIKMRRVALERRAGNAQTAEDLLRSYVACAVKDKEEIFFTRKLAWFLLKISDKKDEAKKMMKDLISKYKSEVKLYNDLVEMEFQCACKDCPKDETDEMVTMEAFDIAMGSDKLTDEQKYNFSQRKLEYLEDFGCDVKRLQRVYDEHQRLVRNQKKRTQIDLTLEETPSKKVKTESTAISVVSASHTSNGSRFTSVAAATATSYTAPGYASADPASLYYQQQQQAQSYWNYAKPNEAPPQSYNYPAWNQYYGQRR